MEIESTDIWHVYAFCNCPDKEIEAPVECMGEVLYECYENQCPYLFLEPVERDIQL